MYSLLADAVIIVHFLFIAFVVAGGLLVMWRPGLAWLHVPAVVWGALIEFAGWICPLTELEDYLRLRGGGEAYSGDFIVHYIAVVIYPAGLTASVQYILGGLVLIINLTVYALVFSRRRSRHRS